jgi:signal transduction histidine kinase
VTTRVHSGDEAPRGLTARGRFLRARHPPERVAAWREAYFHGILVAAVFLPFDFLYPDGLAVTLAVRGALFAVLVACRWLLARVPPDRTGVVAAAGAVTAAVLAPALVATSMAGHGPRFGFLLAVPFILLSLLPEVPHVATLAGLVAAVVGGAVLVAGAVGTAFVVEWTVLASVVTLVTAIGSRRVRQVASLADDAERARHAMLAELEESERRRAASERLALVGRLAAGVGHEINNPLCAVKGNVACALEELERLGGAPEAREALAEALSAADRIAWITADMRALTVEPAGPLGRCHVGDLVREALGHAAGRLRGVEVQTTLDPGLPGVRSEPRLLAQAICQLAAQAARLERSAGGTGRPPTVRISARRVADEIEIAIDGDGPPIPEHVLPRIFEPFAAQGEVRGAGLGLALPLTRVLAERGGGRVRASRRDGGNRFTVTVAVAGD